MNWSHGGQFTARNGSKNSLSYAYQVWCPHVAQGTRPGSKQAQATSVAAPFYAPGGGLPIGRALLPDDAGLPNSQCRPCAPHGAPVSVSAPEAPAGVGEQRHGNGAAVTTRHVTTWPLDDSNSATRASCAIEASGQPLSSRSCCKHHTVPAHVPVISTIPAFACTRPQADRTAEASSSSSVDGATRSSTYRRCSSNIGRSCVPSKNTEGSSNRHSRRQAYPSCRSNRHDKIRGFAGHLHGTSAPSNAATCTDRAEENASGTVIRTFAPPITQAKAPATALVAQSPTKGAAATAAARQPLTLDRLRVQNPELAAIELSVLEQRLEILCGLLHFDNTASLMLCRVVPGLLLTDPATLLRTWARLCIALGGEKPARCACTAAPLLLVMPADRVPTCIASLSAATAMPRPQVAALVAEWPELATHAPASLAAKLDGLRKLLGLVDTEGGTREPAGHTCAVLRSALREAPRLLTFSTAALARHHAELSALLGPDRLATALRREPGLLLLRPATVAAKLALLQQLMDCRQHPGAVAALVVRQPSVLRRSLESLSRGCRVLSIWQLRRRDKLRMCLSRPGLLTLPPIEVHGRCRWLRRLMLSNAYYHAALRRLPPSLVGVLVATLPQAWARLQYLAESSQEYRMHVMDAVECRQDDFAARFPEFTRWLQFKIKLMGAENPWRGALRIRGFTTARDKAIHGTSNQLTLRQRQHQRQHQRSARRSQQQPQQATAWPSVPVVMAEACEVRSGGSTVERPRRILRQPLTSAPVLLSSPESLSRPSCPSAPPSSTLREASGEITDASQAVGVISLPSPLPPPAAPRRRLPSIESDTAAAAVASVGMAVSVAAAELPR